jgi:hypothetical protein
MPDLTGEDAGTRDDCASGDGHEPTLIPRSHDQASRPDGERTDRENGQGVGDRDRTMDVRPVGVGRDAETEVERPNIRKTGRRQAPASYKFLLGDAAAVTVIPGPTSPRVKSAATKTSVSRMRMADPHRCSAKPDGTLTRSGPSIT